MQRPAPSGRGLATAARHEERSRSMARAKPVPPPLLASCAFSEPPRISCFRGLCQFSRTRPHPEVAPPSASAGLLHSVSVPSRAAPATQTCEGSSSTGAHRRRASQRRLVGGLLSWTALDLPLLLLFIVVARIGIYQSKEFKIFSAESSSKAKSADSRIATQRTARFSDPADCLGSVGGSGLPQ